MLAWPSTHHCFRPKLRISRKASLWFLNISVTEKLCSEVEEVGGRGLFSPFRHPPGHGASWGLSRAQGISTHPRAQGFWGGKGSVNCPWEGKNPVLSYFSCKYFSTKMTSNTITKKFNMFNGLCGSQANMPVTLSL